MLTTIEHDPTNHRTVTKWADGENNYCSNVIRAGGRIALHHHHYPHTALAKSGWFDGVDEAPDGTKKTFQIAAEGFVTDHPDFNPIGSEVHVPAWHKHSFTLREAKDIGEILCYWPINHG